MRSFLRKCFTHNWQRKLIALVLSITIWVLINNSITTTKTFSGVPIRIINLPPQKTIEGLLPDGLLDRQMTLTLTGRKTVIQALSPSDLEVVVDARNKADQWVVSVTKQMLVCINGGIDFGRGITDIQHTEFVLKLSPLITEKIPITFTPPVGDPPVGYQFLDIWPMQLYQMVSGPKEKVDELRENGLELTFDLSAISLRDLESLLQSPSGAKNDEIGYPVPEEWKKVHIPFLGSAPQQINDPNAAQLRIDFLKKELLALETRLPLLVFFPLNTSNIVNPLNTTLATNKAVATENGLYFLNIPLYASGVSRLFLDIVQYNLSGAVLPNPNKTKIHWSLQYINTKQLENAYIARAGSDNMTSSNISYLRERFKNYMEELELYIEPGVKLRLDILWQDSKISILDISK